MVGWLVGWLVVVVVVVVVVRTRPPRFSLKSSRFFSKIRNSLHEMSAGELGCVELRGVFALLLQFV